MVVHAHRSEIIYYMFYESHIFSESHDHIAMVAFKCFFLHTFVLNIPIELLHRTGGWLHIFLSKNQSNRIKFNQNKIDNKIYRGTTSCVPRQNAASKRMKSHTSLVDSANSYFLTLHFASELDYLCSVWMSIKGTLLKAVYDWILPLIKYDNILFIHSICKFLQKCVSLHSLIVYGLIILKIIPKSKWKERNNAIAEV